MPSNLGIFSIYFSIYVYINNYFFRIFVGILLYIANDLSINNFKKLLK